MSNAIYHHQIDDFVESTLDSFRKRQSVDISMLLQEYYFASKMLGGKNPERGGPRLKWKLRVDNQEAASHSGLFSVLETNRKNVLTGAQQDWSKQQVSYIYDVDEDEFQSGPEIIIEMMMQHELGLYNDYYALMETALWTAPSSSALSPMPPSGIPFWLQKNATTGFTGGNPSGWASGAGNISTDTYSRWKNYSGTYVEASDDDLVDSVCTAVDYCKFKAPKKYNEIGGGDPDWEFYTHHSVKRTLNKLAKSQNDNIGRDLIYANGEVLIKSIPVQWVPALDNTESDAYDSQAPFYGVNWKKFQYYHKSGRGMVKLPPKEAPNQPTVRVRAMVNWGNFVCYDRRQSGFVFYVAG